MRENHISREARKKKSFPSTVTLLTQKSKKQKAARMGLGYKA